MLTLQLNGETREFPLGPEKALTVDGLLRALNLDLRKIAVERNLEIVPRSTYAEVQLSQHDRLEIVQFIGGGNAPEAPPVDEKPLVFAGKTYKSRLIIGTGKYKTYA